MKYMSKVKKSMMKGLPLFDNVSVLTVLPLMSLSVTDGNCAFAEHKIPSAKTIDNKNFFIINAILLF